MPPTSLAQTDPISFKSNQPQDDTASVLPMSSTRISIERRARRFMPTWIIKAKLHGVETHQMEPSFGSSSFYLCDSLENLYYNLTSTGSFRGKALIVDGELCVIHLDDKKRNMLLLLGEGATQTVKYSALTANFQQFASYVDGLRTHLSATA